MSVTRGPRIVTDGLVLLLDAADKNSYIGQSVNNLLTYTRNYNSAWTQYCGPGNSANITYNTADVLDPINRNTAVKIVRGAPTTCPASTEAWGLYYSPASAVLTAGRTYTTSVYARGASGGEFFDYGLNDTHLVLTQSVSTNWTRYVFTFKNITDATRGFQFRNTSGNNTFYIWGPQTVEGTAMGPYTASVAATNGSIAVKWKDLSGNGNDATTYGSLPFSTERYGCFDFSTVAGASADASIFGFTFTKNMVPTTGNFTFSTWIKNPPATVGQSGLFSNAFGGDGYRFGVGKNGVYWLIGPTYAEGTVSFLNSLNSSDWYNVTAVYARSDAIPQIRVYLNGVLQNTQNLNASQTAFTSTAPGIVRSPCCLPLFTGKLATFSVYNRALTQGEILQNYLAGKSRFTQEYSIENNIITSALNNVNSLIT